MALASLESNLSESVGYWRISSVAPGGSVVDALEAGGKGPRSEQKRLIARPRVSVRAREPRPGEVEVPTFLGCVEHH